MIQLYAAGATGYGSAATALLPATVTTDALGNFTITPRLHVSHCFDPGLYRIHGRQSRPGRRNQQ